MLLQPLKETQENTKNISYFAIPEKMEIKIFTNRSIRFKPVLKFNF